MTSNRRSYPVDSSNALSFNSNNAQYQQQPPMNQIPPQNTGYGQPPVVQQQQEGQQTSPTQVNTFNPYGGGNQNNTGYGQPPVVQQQQQQQQQGGQQTSPVQQTSPNQQNQQEPQGQNTAHPNKRVYPVDSNNDGMLSSNFSQMSLQNQQQYNTPQNQQQNFQQFVPQPQQQSGQQQQQQQQQYNTQQSQQFVPQPQQQYNTQPQQTNDQQQQNFQQFVPQPQQQQSGQQQTYQQFVPQPQTNYTQPQTYQQPTSTYPQQNTTPSFIPEAPLPTEENLCPKKFMRLSMNVVPNLPSSLSKVHIPLGVVINPLAESTPNEVPLINSTIVRCRSCRAYINPFVIFIDGGCRWRCNICQFLNDTPSDYTSPINLTTGKRHDIDQRPELQRGCVEFLATSEYAVRAPQPPCYFFMIDVCYESIVSGMLDSAIRAIRQALNNLPGDSRTRFGIMTYDDQLHLFNLKANPSQRPQMFVITEMDNVFVPPYDDFLVNLKDNRQLVENTLSAIQSMDRTKTQKVESCLGSALKAAYSITQRVGGKLIILQSYIPRGPVGKLVLRDFQPLLGNKKEISLLQPNNEGEFYKEFALGCSQQHISIDIFLFSNEYTDVASLGSMCQITGGEVHYYPGFVSTRDGPVFEHNLTHALTRQTAWEAVMRVRNSRGLNTTSYHGNYFLKSSDLLALPTVDSDKSFTLQLSITENINAKYAALQSALLYTHSCGERRVRVFTVSIPVVQNFHDLFKFADISVVVNLISKMAIDKALSSSLPDAREAIANKCAEILIAYKTTLASNATNSVTLSNQAPKLLLPESLKHLPLYVVAMVKNIIFSSKPTHPDQRSYFMQRMKTLDTSLCLTFFYPYFYSLLPPPQTNVNELLAQEPFHLPVSHKLSSDELSRTGCYAIVNGFTIYIFAGENINQQSQLDIFGCDFNSLDQLTFQEFPELDNDHSRYVRKIIGTIRSNFTRAMKIYMVKGNTSRRSEIQSLLVEDRTPEGSSYYEFILQLQNRVTQ